MRRRRALALLGTVGSGALAGCNGLLKSDEDRTFEIENGPSPDGLPAEISATIVREMSEDNPAKIEISCENTSENPIFITFDWPAPFSTLVGHHQSGSARLMLGSEKVVPDQTDSCWTGDTSAKNAPGTDRIRLTASENISVLWSLYNHPSNEECFPDGRFRFEETYTHNGEHFDWWFDILKG